MSPPSQINVCTASSGIVEKRPRRFHSPPKSSDLGQWSSRLRARRKSLPNPSTDLQTKPKTSQSLVPEGQDLISRRTEQKDRPLKRTRESEEPLPAKRARLETSPEPKASPTTSRPTGIHAIKPLTKTNLKLLQESMSKSASTSRGGSAPHRRVSALTSSKRSLTAPEVSETSSNSRAYAATSLKYQECLEECGLDGTGLIERPNQQDLETLRRVLARERDSPEPDSQFFYLTRAMVHQKNEVSIAKR